MRLLERRTLLGLAIAAISGAMMLPVIYFSVVFRLLGDTLDVVGPSPTGTTELQLDPAGRYLVNPGSVGQPRDGDPRAAYAIYDTTAQRIDLLRVPYDIDVTQAKMRKAGLPEPLSRRLSAGR